MNTHRSSTVISNFSAKITIEPHCISIYVQPALYESYRQQYVWKETSSPLPILTLLQTAPLPSFHGRQRRMWNHQTLYPFCFSTVSSVLCSSRWCSSFFCGKTSRRRKRSDGCFSFEFYSRQQITIAYLKLPCLTTKRSRDSTPLSYSSLHGEYQRGLAHVETGLEWQRRRTTTTTVSQMGSSQSSIAKLSCKSYHRARNYSKSNIKCRLLSTRKDRRRSQENLLNSTIQEDPSRSSLVFFSLDDGSCVMTEMILVHSRSIHCCERVSCWSTVRDLSAKTRAGRFGLWQWISSKSRTLLRTLQAWCPFRWCLEYSTFSRTFMFVSQSSSRRREESFREHLTDWYHSCATQSSEWWSNVGLHQC